jgi:two-component sensor histidine kinase/PAS domain-containing protein
MATLGELLHASTELSDSDLDHLHSLVGEWDMLSDLSFADLLLLVPLQEAAEFLIVAQVRPATGPTAYQHDLVGDRLTAGLRPAVATCWREGRIVREGDPEWDTGFPVRQEAVPVRHGDRVIAVLARDTNLAVARSPSPLELAYLRSAADLTQMIAEGRFPFHGRSREMVEAPRVGDGVLRVDAGGDVVYASPNALSAYRRMGFTGNLTGENLQSVHASVVQMDPDRPAGQVAVWEAVRRGEPVENELLASGSVVLLRAIPLLPGGQLVGQLVLVRDVTELRRREAQLLSKDATIREIHHRVKNNLQTVAALLRLQARRTPTAETSAALREAVRRVTSIALVHETLSHTPEESVAFDEIADELVGITLDVASTGRRPETRRKGSFGMLPGQIATPLALVLSELLQNALEHAFGSTELPTEGGFLLEAEVPAYAKAPAGVIEVRVTRDQERLTVVVADDGAGLPTGFALDSSTRLGLQIVRSLVVSELRGTFALTPGAHGGTEAIVAVPAAVL